MPSPRKVVISHFCAPGDTVVLSAAIKALHETQPGAFLTDYIGHNGRTAPKGNNLFENSPYITELDPADSEYVMLDYGYGISGNEYGGGCGRPYHFLHAFVENLERRLGVHIELRDFRGDIWLSDEERKPWPGLPERYAVIDAGHKADFVAKHWSDYRYQEVVNRTKDKIAWVQIGAANDRHPQLENVVNLVGQTNLRDLCQVIHRSSLVLTPVSLPMHLAAAVPTVDDTPKRKPLTIAERHERHALRCVRGCVDDLVRPMVYNRPCVVLGGQREPRAWEQYPGHTWLGADGKLMCGIKPGAGCWSNKTVMIPGDGDTNICRLAMVDERGAWVPECLYRVSIEECVAAVERWL